MLHARRPASRSFYRTLVGAFTRPAVFSIKCRRMRRAAWIPEGLCAALFVALLILLSARSAQAQPTQAELQDPHPLEIIHPIETVADLQRELDQLEARSTNVDGLLAENAKNIYGGTSQALNSTAEAVLGPIFARPAEYESIQKNLTQAATAAQGAKDALAQAEAALQAGRTSLALTKTAEAVALAREAQTKSKDAYEQTAAIFKRTNSVLTGEMSPAQLKELAQRYWESRHDLSTAAKGLLTYLNADEEQRLLIALKHEVRNEIDRLTDLKAQQAFAPFASLPLPPPPDGPPPLTPPDGPNTPVSVQPAATDANTPVAVPPAATDPNTPVTVATVTDPNMPPVNSLTGGGDPSRPSGSSGSTPQSGSIDSNWWGCKGDLCDNYHDLGDRAFDRPNGDPTQAQAEAKAARDQFYRDNPQLTTLKVPGESQTIQEIAGQYSPADQIDEAVQKGLLGSSVGAPDRLIDQADPSQVAKAQEDPLQPSDVANRPALLDEGSSSSQRSQTASLNGELSSPGDIYLTTEPATPSQIASARRALEDAAKAAERAERRNSLIQSGEGNSPSESRWAKALPWINFGLGLLDTYNQIQSQRQYQQYQIQQRQLQQQRYQEQQRADAAARSAASRNAPGGTTLAPQTIPPPSPQMSPMNSLPPPTLCGPGMVINPAAIACMNSPVLIDGLPNNCQRVGGNPANPYIDWCVLAGKGK